MVAYHLVDIPKFRTSLPLIPSQSYLSPTNIIASLDANGLSFKASTFCPKYASSVVQGPKGSDGFVAGCASWGLKRELEVDVKSEEDEKKNRNGMTRFRHKCREREGIVELLECLEREAIMGEDVGKEPMDYNRRAQIFHRSSQVFQALKELDNDTLSQKSV